MWGKGEDPEEMHTSLWPVRSPDGKAVLVEGARAVSIQAMLLPLVIQAMLLYLKIQAMRLNLKIQPMLLTLMILAIA